MTFGATMSETNKSLITAIWQDRSFRLSILLTFIFLATGLVFLLLGIADYSWLLFILLPVLLGIAIGSMPVKKYTLLAVVIATVCFLMGLYIPGVSGFICVTLSLGLIVPCILTGYVIIYLWRRYKEIKATHNLSILLLPLLPFLLSAPLEHFFKKDKTAVVTVSTEQVFNYTPEQVYDAIKAVDTLDAERPWLMSFDLPVPTKCVLEKEEVGGIRTCYFKKGNLSNAEFGSGTITEKITQLERGKILKMDVTNYNLIGRKWLGFKEAIYYFDKVGDHSCKLTRVTTYTSILSPRWYWQPVEELSIRQEHQYVFNNLAKDLQLKYRKK